MDRAGRSTNGTHVAYDGTDVLLVGITLAQIDQDSNFAF
ncbi:hypothetical protein Wenmar_01774 [Wenxinia marina DSM 24838]|uniref:Uncharacterized protein n=1 Tax=Wenxinia marina DSM 24838 TaxID=1123501 RepID=A0A0D0QAS9_9RHOB|nr:hypothetical protein Wenmar_01774 [Wenxinia marina DSM 24838]